MKLTSISILATLACAATPLSAATLAVNFMHGGFSGTTGIGAGENTNALNTVAGLVTPTWNNLAINGAGSLANGRGSGTFSGITVGAYGSTSWSSGSETVVSGDASQQVFRYYLDDGDGGNGYFNGDGVGASIHLTGLNAFMLSNSASSYTLTLFFNSDVNNNIFPNATVRNGIPGTPSATAITSLPVLGSLSATYIGNGQAPINNAVAGGGTRSWGQLTGLTADNLVVSMPTGVFTPAGRASVAGFAITPVPEPSSLMLSALAAGVLMRRRRTSV